MRVFYAWESSVGVEEGRADGEVGWVVGGARGVVDPQGWGGQVGIVDGEISWSC